MQEIEELGLEEHEPSSPEMPEKGTSSAVPLIQAVLCLLFLAVLLALRYTGSPVYDTFAEWYEQEAAEEIQLPAWDGPEATPEPSPTVSPSPSASPGPWETDASLQRV